MKPLPAVIVAAGSSSRLGQPKQLLVFEREPLLQRAIRIAHEAGASPVLVVLGAHREPIASAVDFRPVTIVNNEHWAEGIASSIRTGVRALEKEVSDCSGVLLMLCDQPGVTAEHLRKMIHKFAQSDQSAVASVYAGKRGIPAIFPRAAFLDLLALEGDKGARKLLADPARYVIDIPLEGGEIDIDLPEDLVNLD